LPTREGFGYSVFMPAPTPRRKQPTHAQLERAFQEELARIHRKTSEKHRLYEKERLKHLCECHDESCSQCGMYEGLIPETVARVRAERKLRTRRKS